MSSGWVNPGRQLSHSLTFPQQNSRESQGQKWEIMLQRQFNWQSKSYTCQQSKIGTHSLLSIRQLLSQLFYLEHDVLWSGISHCSLEVSCPSSVSSQFFVRFQPPCPWGSIIEDLEAMCALLSNTKTLVCYQHSFGHKSKRMQHTNYYEEN